MREREIDLTQSVIGSARESVARLTANRADDFGHHGNRAARRAAARDGAHGKGGRKVKRGRSGR